MTILIRKPKNFIPDGEEYLWPAREISLYDLLDFENYSTGQIETNTKILKGLSNFIEVFMESFPEGKNFLKDYISKSYVGNLEYREKEIDDNAC